MPNSNLLERFLREECDSMVIQLITAAIDKQKIGVKTLTFNVYDVILDFDSSMATIESVIDVTEEGHLTLPIQKLIDEFKKNEF